MWLRFFLLLLLWVLTGCAAPITTTSLPDATPIPYEQVLPPGMIEVLDAPQTVTVAEADTHIGAHDIIMGVVIEGQSRAYPIGLMRRYGITNDVLNEQPIAVTFCNACNTGLAFSRQVGEQVLRFDVSGLLFNGALVMTDRETGSHWSQIMLKALEGTYAGSPLTLLASNQMTWQEWRTNYPDTTLVIDPRAPEPTGNTFTLPVVPTGDELSAESFHGYVIGLTTDGGATAYTIDAVERDGLVQEAQESQPPILLVALGAKGAVAVWDRRIEDRILTFQREAGQLMDVETQSVWDPTQGVATSGPLAGTQLSALPIWVTDWRGWFDLYPQTRLYQ